MSVLNNVPGVRTILTDGNLSQGQAGPTNDSILIIGTAGQGPINDPIAITSVEDAVRIFGSPYDGDLVRGVIEAWYGTVGGTPDIRAVRLGGPSPASVDIPESTTGTGASGATSTGYAIRVTANDPGAIFNNFTIGYSRYNNNAAAIVISNPKTGLSSYYTFNITNNDDTSVDVHDVNELVNAINNDTNLNPYITASFEPISVAYGIDLSYEDNITKSGVSVSTSTPTSGTVTLDLEARLLGDASYTQTNLALPGYGVTGYTFNASAMNRVYNIDRVYEIGSYGKLILGGASGVSSYKLPVTPRKVLETDKYLADVDGFGYWPAGASHIAEVRLHATDLVSDPIETDYTTGDVSFTVRNVWLPPDIGYFPPESGFTDAWTFMNTSGVSGSIPSGYTMAWACADAAGLEDETRTVDALQSKHPRYQLKIKRVSSTGTTETFYDAANIKVCPKDSGVTWDGDGWTWDTTNFSEYHYCVGSSGDDLNDTSSGAAVFRDATRILYRDNDPGAWFTAYNSTTKELTITVPSLFVAAKHIDAGDTLLVSFTTLIGELTEVDYSNLPSYTSPLYYAVNGNQLYFASAIGDNWSYEVGCRYFNEYTPYNGTTGDIEILGKTDAKLHWVNPKNQPGSYQDRWRSTLASNGIATGTAKDGTSLATKSIPSGFSDTTYIAGTGGTAWGASVVGAYADAATGTIPHNSGAKVATATGCECHLGLVYDALPEFINTTTTYRLTGGTNGNFTEDQVDQRYEALEDLVDYLDGYDVDYIVPMGCYIDDGMRVTTSIGEDVVAAKYFDILGNLLSDLHDNYADTQVILSTKPPSTLTIAGKKEYYTDLVTVDYRRGITAANVMFGLSDSFSSLVADSLKPFFKFTTGGAWFYLPDVSSRRYVAPISATYAGYLSSAPYNVSPTNKRLGGVVDCVYNFMGKELNALAGSRFVVLHKGADGSPVTAATITAANSDSDYKQEHVLRTVLACTRSVRDVCALYIGGVSNVATIEAMRSSIFERLNRMVDAGGIQPGYQVAISHRDPGDAINGKLTVDLSIVTTFEIKRVDIRVKVLENAVQTEIQ